MPRGKRDLKYTWTCRLEVEVFFVDNGERKFSKESRSQGIDCRKSRSRVAGSQEVE